VNFQVLMAAFTLAATIISEIAAASAEAASGQPISIVSPLPVGLFGHKFNLSISGTPVAVGAGGGALELHGVFALFQLAFALAQGAVGAIQSAQSGSAFSISQSASLYGHQYSLSISGSPAVAEAGTAAPTA